jgi:NAD(P) transhydrogenase subunit alpha
MPLKLWMSGLALLGLLAVTVSAATAQPAQTQPAIGGGMVPVFPTTQPAPAPVHTTDQPGPVTTQPATPVAGQSTPGASAPGAAAQPAAAEASGAPAAADHEAQQPSLDFMSMLFVFMLATFLGIGVIRRVSRLLHTPLMSLTNAISAIAVVGAIMVAGGQRDYPFAIRLLGGIALFCSMTNIISGFLITDRMLKMFKTREGGKA